MDDMHTHIGVGMMIVTVGPVLAFPGQFRLVSRDIFFFDLFFAFDKAVAAVFAVIFSLRTDSAASRTIGVVLDPGPGDFAFCTGAEICGTFIASNGIDDDSQYDEKRDEYYGKTDQSIYDV